MTTLLLVLGIYFIGCILAVLLELLHLKLSAKRFGKIIVPSFKTYWPGYLMFTVTSWIGFLILLVTLITAWIRRIY